MRPHVVATPHQTPRYATGFTAAMVLLLSLANSPPAHAKLYKWVDDQGNVTYSQQKPPGRKAQTIELKGIQSPDPGAQGKLDARKEQAESDRKDREFAKQDSDASKARRERLKKNCEIARQNVRILKSSTRIQDKDERGQPVYLDTAGISAKLAQAEKQVEDYCN